MGHMARLVRCANLNMLKLVSECCMSVHLWDKSFGKMFDLFLAFAGVQHRIPRLTIH